MCIGDPRSMLKPVRCFLVIALVVSFCGNSLAQRKSVPRSSLDIGSAMDALGVGQPESVKSILLLYSGKSLSKSKVDEMEADIRKSPDKIEGRLVLIGYYTSNARTSLERLR